MTIPTSPNDLTPDTLTAILRAAGHLTDSRVTQIHVTNANDSSGIIGQTVRLQVEYDQSTDMPTAFIAKFPTQHADRRDYFSALGMYTREVYFYQQLADSIPLNLPRCYVALLDATSERAFVLIEDLSPAETGNRVTGCTVDVAEQALTTVARLHTTWWNSPRLAGINWLQSHNQAAFEAQFHRSWAAYCTTFADQMPDDLQQLGDALSRNLVQLSRLWQPPLTLIHRDYNLDNLLFKRDRAGNELLYVIDWQLVRQGRAVFDVATFLCWNLQLDVRREAEQHLLKHYHTALINAGITDYSFEDCLADYQLAQLECLSRTLAILGSGMVTEAHLLTLLQTILARNLAAIRDWDVYAVLRL